jgi:hypothetical protein
VSQKLPKCAIRDVDLKSTPRARVKPLNSGSEHIFENSSICFIENHLFYDTLNLPVLKKRRINRKWVKGYAVCRAADWTQMLLMEPNGKASRRMKGGRDRAGQPPLVKKPSLPG